MATFSVLCTNTRNGGQCELSIQAIDADGAKQIVAETRPHYIIKRIDAVA